LRKATARFAVIAASALVIPALGLPPLAPSTATVVRRGNAAAAEEQIRRISRATPPVAPAIGRHFAHLRSTGRAMKGPVVIISAWRGRVAAAPRPAEPKTEATPISRFYVVRTGDSLWTIAQRYEVSVERLAAANGLRLTSTLSLGRRLRIPAMGGPEVAAADPASDAPAVDAVGRAARAEARATQRTLARQSEGSALMHTVRGGDSTWLIARRYNIKVDDLIEANDLGEDGRIQPGQRLTIPGRQAGDGRDLVAPRRAPDTRRPPAQVAEPRGPRRTAFIWPSRGVLTSRFGMRYRRHHNGIDIASPTGTPIYAARAGVVTFAARRGGYGLVVYVDHGDGYTTVYGHASVLHVKVGDRVKSGELIARVGCTGSCTGSHVHFEVHESGTPVNPLKHLR
jgi:murein DD-endopeptidase MepM/ murein hydrolase activator NlpD